VLDPTRTLAQGAALPLELDGHETTKKRFLRQLAAAGVPLERPVGKLAATHRRRILDGDKGQQGLLALLSEAAAEGGEDAFEDFFVERPCTACGGHRLNARARAVRLQGHGIADLLGLPVAEAE